MNEKLQEKVAALADSHRDVWGDRVDEFTPVVIEICEHYAEKLELDPVAVFDALERQRTYSFPNYYQWSNFPRLDNVMIFETQEDLMAAIDPGQGFRCPLCGGVSHSPYECDTGLPMPNTKGKICDWKAYGLFKTLGTGISLLVKKDWLENAHIENIFMPVCMEAAPPLSLEVIPPPTSDGGRSGIKIEIDDD